MGGREGKGGQRLRRRARSCDSEKRQFHCLHRSPPPTHTHSHTPQDWGGIFLSRSTGTAEGKTRLFPWEAKQRCFERVNEKEGRKRWLRRLFFFFFFFWWESRMGNALEGANNLTRQQNKTNKIWMQHQLFSFSAFWFPQQTHPQHPECHWVTARDTRGESPAVHKTWWWFNVSLVFFFLFVSTVKADRSKQREPKLGGKGITLICKSSKRDGLQMDVWRGPESRGGGSLQWNKDRIQSLSSSCLCYLCWGVQL